MTFHHHDHSPHRGAKKELTEEELDEVIIDASFQEIVFERKKFEVNTSIPQNFTAVTIWLDCSINSSLDWQKEITLTEQFINQGYKVVFDLDLGLFQHLTLPLSHPTQFQALNKALEYFYETIIEKFHSSIVAIILYKGDLDWSKELIWNETLQYSYEEWLFGKSFADEHQKRFFCRDSASEYLQLLAERIPESIPVFALVDAKTVTSPLLFAQLIAKDCYGRIHLAISHPRFPVYQTIWEEAEHSTQFGYIGRCYPMKQVISEAKIGILFPAYTNTNPEAYLDLEKVLLNLLEKENSEPFRIISEEQLTIEWDGIDTLYVCRQQILATTERKLQGFIAAGGDVICC